MDGVIRSVDDSANSVAVAVGEHHERMALVQGLHVLVNRHLGPLLHHYYHLIIYVDFNHLSKQKKDKFNRREFLIFKITMQYNTLNYIILIPYLGITKPMDLDTPLPWPWKSRSEALVGKKPCSPVLLAYA